MRINLDEMFAELDTMIDDQQMVQWMRGFRCGSRGGANPWAAGSPGHAGHRFGLRAKSEADAFRDKKSAAGTASATARKGQFGSPDPRAIREQNVNTTKGVFEQVAEHHREQCSNQDTEQRSNHPISNIQQPISNSEVANIQDVRTVATASPLAWGTAEDPMVMAAMNHGRYVPPPKQYGIADLQALFPAFWIRSEDMDQARVLVTLYGGKNCHEVLTDLTASAAKSPKGKNKIFLSAFKYRLTNRFGLSVEDYERAGLTAPEGTPHDVH